MLIECDDISYRYPHAENYVFEHLTVTMAEPGFNALFGPSGVGKTSFAKIITGDITGCSGDIRLGGIGQVAYTYNTERLPGWSAIGTHLKRIIPEEKQPLIEELVDTFGLGKCLDQRFAQLSLGQKNRINLLRYLLQDFNLIILDESLANVDELTREKILFKIKTMFPEVLFLYISHNVVEVSKFCRDILVFRGANKSPQTVKVKGLDLKDGEIMDRLELDRAMLEIMNAA